MNSISHFRIIFLIGLFFYLTTSLFAQDVVRRLDELNSFDKGIIVANEAAVFERNLDDSYYTTTIDGKLYFRFTEKYLDQSLDLELYNWKREKLFVTSLTVSKLYGENWYVLDGASLLLVEPLVSNSYYVLEVLDENKVKTVLRFKYLFAPQTLRLSCAGVSSTTSGCNTEIVISYPEQDVTVNSVIEEGIGPFKITWTLIKEDDHGDIIESLVVKEETTNELNHTFVKLLKQWVTPYKIQLKVEDNCGNERYCVFCVKTPTDERVSSEKKSKFFLFFKIKTDKKDKDKDTPNSQDDKENKNN